MSNWLVPYRPRHAKTTLKIATIETQRGLSIIPFRFYFYNTLRVLKMIKVKINNYLI
ncbi:hypothetical protein KAX08_05930 [candidate division WOR-3 bacterium]|nr:hypothetical protein [candidate division WOR-3 bacterium]